ncbi:MAG: hypothetical protein IPK19_19505 [Chloroflexi bacterium]|nr:hypothetical protein [Chloroflexota bacterium]
MAAHEICPSIVSPSEVFTWLDDPQKAGQWVPGPVDIQAIHAGRQPRRAKPPCLPREWSHVRD